ncbi:MAG: pyridoxamine 5'-phosphate oxidase family protein [Caulobacteraceae bacterium]|nr:pyridoxamine 5'-phosphate oxidase family protein [Caulobacteraceae bacterium]
MGKSYPCLDDRSIAFIRAQRIFFVATAPLAPDGHVNLSPKGYDSLAILDERTIAYADLGGSGIETHAHVRENGRITLMFCAFDGPANIVRVYGRGEAVSFDDPGFETAMAAFPTVRRARGVIRVHVERVADSCGWGVPVFEFKQEREQLLRWVEAKPFDEWAQHRRHANAASIDGLPGLAAGKRPEGR